jgi:hypothetical protein
MLTRRHFLTTTGALLMTTLLPGKPWQPLWPKKSVIHGKELTRRTAKETITPGWILQSLGLQPGSTELRRAIFELVRRMPYQLGHGITKA